MGFPSLIPKEVLPAMTQLSSTTRPTMWVAIDIAKVYNQVLVEFPDGRQRRRFGLFLSPNPSSL
jgi:hypothetical protein